MDLPTEALTNVGLSDREAEVYTTLLRLGEVPVVELIRATGTHPQLIYRALERLQAQRLVTSIQHKHRKYVRAEDPDRLERIAEDHLQKIRSVVPKLEALQIRSPRTVVRTYQGADELAAFRAHLLAPLESGETYYVIGGAAQYYREMTLKRHEAGERSRVRKKVWKRVVTFSSQRKAIERFDKGRPYTEYQFLADDFDTPSTITIARDTVGLMLWDTEPIVIELRSKLLAESYRHYFDVLWRLAKS